MIEEAAGTRLYESKKEAAQRTIEKKDAKLREIDMVHNDWFDTVCWLVFYWFSHAMIWYVFYRF